MGVVLHVSPGDAMIEPCAKCEMLRPEFNKLSKQWRHDTRLAAHHHPEHPCHRAIVGMGIDVLPLIVEKLIVRDGWWFCALREILPDAPTMEDWMLGRIDVLRALWMAWIEAKYPAAWNAAQRAIKEKQNERK